MLSVMNGELLRAAAATVEEFGEDEGEFGEGAFGESGEGGAEGGGFDGAGLVGVREFLPKMLPEILEVGGHLAKCSNKHHSGGGRCKEEEGEPRGRRACDRDGHATVGEVRLRRRDFGHDRDGSCHGGVDR